MAGTWDQDYIDISRYITVGVCGSEGVCLCTGEGVKDAEMLLRAPPCHGSSGPEPENTQESFKITVTQCTEVPVPDTVLSAGGGGTPFWTSFVQSNHESLWDTWRQRPSEVV